MSDDSVCTQVQERSKTDADNAKNGSLENEEKSSTPILTTETTEDVVDDVSSDSDEGTLIAVAQDVVQDNEEHKKLVNQEESFEELPYVPTTLPLER